MPVQLVKLSITAIMRVKARVRIHMSIKENLSITTAPIISIITELITSITTKLILSIATIMMKRIKMGKMIIVVPAMSLNFNNRTDPFPVVLMHQRIPHFLLYTMYF